MASKKNKKSSSVKLTNLIADEIKATAAAPEPPTPVEPKPPKLKNYIALLLDDSGSMRGCYQEALRQLNLNLASIRAKAQETGQETFVSVYLFGGGGMVWRKVPWTPVEDVQALNFPFAHGPSTPLIDAIGTAITDGMSGPDANDPNASFLILCATDGKENGSRLYGSEFNPEPLLKLINKAQATDRWTLAVMVPKGDKRQVTRLGIPEGNVTEWDNTTRGATEAFTRTASSFDSYYNARSGGQKSVKTFYTTDLSTLKKADLSKMTDLSSRFKKWTVEKEMQLQPYVESKGVPFVVGASYYQFTKRELLRSGRTLLIREKGTNRIFGGADARAILGIPDGEVHVTPGNHANYDLFMQSTSHNRALVRGTELYYDLTHRPGQSPQTWNWQEAERIANEKKAQQTTV